LSHLLQAQSGPGALLLLACHAPRVAQLLAQQVEGDRELNRGRKRVVPPAAGAERPGRSSSSRVPRASRCAAACSAGSAAASRRRRLARQSTTQYQNSCDPGSLNAQFLYRYVPIRYRFQVSLFKPSVKAPNPLNRLIGPQNPLIYLIGT
jgi:hypothetical protein